MIKFLRKMFGWCSHEWTTWELKESKKESNEMTGLTYWSTLQQRKCTKCGYIQMDRTVR